MAIVRTLVLLVLLALKPGIEVPFIAAPDYRQSIIACNINKTWIFVGFF